VRYRISNAIDSVTGNTK